METKICKCLVLSYTRVLVNDIMVINCSNCSKQLSIETLLLLMMKKLYNNKSGTTTTVIFEWTTSPGMILS